VPFSVKDLTNTAGVRTTMGSAIFETNVPKEDAVAVARAKAAGAILIGKTTTPEFGHKQSTDAPIFGQTLNPIDPNVTCGASSGGAAVAVAAGMGPLALGTDGGGSIRIPAACCGVVGLKATLGADRQFAAADLFSANSYVGPMARDVADTAPAVRGDRRSRCRRSLWPDRAAAGAFARQFQGRPHRLAGTLRRAPARRPRRRRDPRLCEGWKRWARSSNRSHWISSRSNRRSW
jgi:Asp-tRNA(Asn)/Glu-tRNA(Gln) amidotransferase A subunit family amidase